MLFEAALPKTITQYKVFIGSPGGLEDERRRFKDALEKCSLQYGLEKDVRFHPVRWEDTVGGAGRAQAIINDELRQCDYAVFVLHDHWGSPTGNGSSSGTGEEWELAEELYRANKIKNIALFFKKVDPARLRDPGDQLKAVLSFRKRIEDEKRYLYYSFDTLEQFSDRLDGHLAKWLKDHEKMGSVELAAATPIINGPSIAATPGFAFWMKESREASEARSDQALALHFATRAAAAATSDVDWAVATNAVGIAQYKLGASNLAIVHFAAIGNRFETATDPDGRLWRARSLYNKGVTLAAMGRATDAIAVYDDLVDRFGDATELSLREEVISALFHKGCLLQDVLARPKEALGVFDDLISRCGDAKEVSLRQQVANALLRKAYVLGNILESSQDAITVYDKLITRFEDSTELSLREKVGWALFNKAFRLEALGRLQDAIPVFDDLIMRFGTSTEPVLREQVAKSLLQKGVGLGSIGRPKDAIAVYDDLIRRFGDATERVLVEIVAIALCNKGLTIGAHERPNNAIVAYDDLIGRFKLVTDPPVRAQVAKALLNKGISLGAMGRTDDANAVYNEIIDCFGTSTEPAIMHHVESARGKLPFPQMLKRELESLYRSIASSWQWLKAVRLTTP